MKVDRNEKVAGLDVRLARDLLRELANTRTEWRIKVATWYLRKLEWFAHVDDLIARGKCPKDLRAYLRRWDPEYHEQPPSGLAYKKIPDRMREARAAVKAFVAEGYLEVTPRDGAANALTDKGVQFIEVRFVPRMNRAKALCCRACLARAAEINADPSMLYDVTELRVFGSYLKDTDDIGDLDMTVELADRRYLFKDFYAFLDACRERFPQNCGLIGNDGARRAVMVRLKSRSPRITLCSPSVLQQNPDEPAWPSRVVYSYVAPEAKRWARAEKAKAKAKVREDEPLPGPAAS